MSTLVSHSCDNTTGINKILTTGTVTATSGGGRTFLRVVGASSWSTNGFALDAFTAGVKNQVLYVNVRTSAAPFIFGFATTQTITIAEIRGFYVPSPIVQVWNLGAPGGSQTFTFNTWYNLMLIVAGNGDIQGYVHADDGTAHKEITNWTYIGNITVGGGYDPLASDLYFVTSVNTTGNVDFDFIEHTDNGFPADALTPQLIFSDEIDNYDNFTKVETGAVSAIVTAGGRTYSQGDGSGVVDVNGLHTTAAMATGDMGHTIYIDGFPEEFTLQNSHVTIRQDASIAFDTATSTSLAFASSDMSKRRMLIFTGLHSLGGANDEDWWNLRYRIEASGRVVSSFHKDDGTLPWEVAEADWIWKGISESNGFRGADVYFSTMQYSTDPAFLGIDRLYYTADGTVPAEATANSYAGSSDQRIRTMRRKYHG